MYIDENGDDVEVFQFVYTWALSNYQAESVVYAAVCTNNTVGAELWLRMMRRYRFCEHENEYYEKELGCVCRAGKDCAPKSAEQRTFHFSQSPALAYVILVAVIITFAASYYHLSQMRQLLGEKKSAEGLYGMTSATATSPRPPAGPRLASASGAGASTVHNRGFLATR